MGLLIRAGLRGQTLVALAPVGSALAALVAMKLAELAAIQQVLGVQRVKRPMAEAP